ncbi:hypothetical protein [Sinomonas sp. ASV322]|uniref:hypothetical protein n=1 Tax=Sinomonas sp. ASV322 TaxID=3041920 RepID=UPI0027DDB408|nr:hypothetical protein [Sinomonas sp. ASV322]MDQ4504318.1 hypothetical protein [Sinomonas sp. ASV322]
MAPAFEEYIGAYTAWGTQMFGVFDQGVNTMLTAITTQEATDQPHLYKNAIGVTVADATEELSLANTAKAGADQDAAYCTQSANGLQSQLDALRADATKFNLGAVPGTIGEIATVVGAVIAAIPLGECPRRGRRASARP